MPDVVQLGRRVKNKYPGVYDDIPDGVLGQKVKAKFPGAYDDFVDTAYTPPPERSGGAAFSGGLATAGGEAMVEPAVSLYEAGKSAVGGEFGPLGQLAESYGRGAARLLMGGNPSFAGAIKPNEAEIARLAAERQAREGQTPAGQYVQRTRAKLAAEHAGDTSLTNKILYGGGRVLGNVAPVVAAGVATGGSIPAIAATTALQSAAQPENAALNVAVSAVPVPLGQAFKAGLNGVRRIFGKGAAQIIEAEALPAATAQVRANVPEAAPVTGEVPPVAGNASPAVQNAMRQFEQEVARIKTLPPAQQAAEMQAAIQSIGREASGVRPVSPESRAGYPPLMEFPENPNAIQQAGRLPFEAAQDPLFDRAWQAIADFGEDALNRKGIVTVLQRRLKINYDRASRLVEQMKAEAAPMQGRQVGRVVTVGDKTYRLNPEQEARWVAEVDEPLAQATQKAKDFEAFGHGRQEAAKMRKGAAMRIAAVKREIVGALTDKERAAIAAREATNYKGKPVEVDGQPGTVQGVAFGRVKVKLDDGQTVNVPPSSVTARGPANVAPMETGQPSLGEVIGGQLRSMARTPTSPVSLPLLRERFPSVSKQQFDDEVLKLAEEGQIAIHRNDAPGLLSEAERNGLLKVGNDYYTAATVRGPSVTAPMEMNTPTPRTVGGAPTADINAPFEGAWENQPVQQALLEGVRGLPKSIAQHFKDETLGLLGLSKSLKSTLDVSFPFRQGAILLLRPFQWRQSQKVIKDMFRAFRAKDFKAINQAIARHPDTPLAKEAGLALDVAEEAFPSRAGSKISEFVTNKAGRYIGIKQSNQAYDTAAKVQRFEAFQQYKNLIDKKALSPEEAMKGYKAAAQWINIATGRGSLGQTIDRAFEALNYGIFSPRFVASRINVLNPAMYIRNATSPGGRVVLRQQMADLAQFASVVGTTLYLAKQAGAEINTHISSSDFLKIKKGNWRYDLGAGIQQVMRLYYLLGADFARAGRGEKPGRKDAIDIAETFLNYKLSPPMAAFRDFIKQRTIKGKDPTAGSYIENFIAPMQWADFVDAYQKEAWGGVAKTLPGAAGVSVQNYEQTPVEAAIERAQPLFTELKRLNKTVSELKKRGEGDKKEPDDIFNGRVQQFGQNYTLYGLKLLDNERFKAASDDIKGKALDALNNRAKALTVREFAFPELELDPDTILDSVQSAEERKQERVRQRGF